jgi:enoyl-CoA hydratase
VSVPDLTLYQQRFASLKFAAHPGGILELILSGEKTLNAADAAMHRDLANVWREIDLDPQVRVVVVRGEGRAFSAGGDLALVQDMADSWETRTRVWKEARDLVYNLIHCSKPVVSAVHGACVGAGLAVALLADISVAAPDARILDGHTRLGVAAGDHAIIIWPLLCGLNKAKYYLLLGEPLSGQEAERLGLISLCVPETEVLERAFSVARRLSQSSQSAIRWTKAALNTWLQLAGPSFDASLALEFMGFSGPDVQEGLASFREKRAPDFGAVVGHSDRTRTE